MENIRLSNIPDDTIIHDDDRLLGTDSSQTETKNYRADLLKEFILSDNDIYYFGSPVLDGSWKIETFFDEGRKKLGFYRREANIWTLKGNFDNSIHSDSGYFKNSILEFFETYETTPVANAFRQIAGDANDGADTTLRYILPNGDIRQTLGSLVYSSTHAEDVGTAEVWDPVTQEYNRIMTIITKTATEFNNSDPTLKLGVLGFESDTGKVKIGDGVKNWATLPYLDSGTVIQETPITIRNKLQSLSGDERLGIEDLKDVETTISGDYCKTKLEELTGDDRLDADAIKNLPSPTTTTFDALTDTPSSKTSQEGKLVRVNEFGTSLEYHTPTLDELGDVNELDTPNNKDIIRFNSSISKWNAEPERLPINYVSYTTNGLFGGIKDAQVNFIYVDDNNSAILSTPETPIDGDLLIIKNDNDMAGRTITVNARSGQTINGSTSYSVGTDGKKDHFVWVASTNNWKFVGEETAVDRIGTMTGIITDGEMNTYLTGLGFSKTGGTSGVRVFAWKDRNLPTLSTTDIYDIYYIHSTVLQDNLQTLNLPSQLKEGTIVSIENNDRSKYCYLVPASGETIDSSSASFKLDYDMLNYFVKQGTNWVHALGGVLPNNVQALASTVKVQLDDELHTFQEIDDEMVRRMFRKKPGKMGVRNDQAVPTNNDWVKREFFSGEEFVLPAQSSGNQYVVFSLPVDIAPLVKEVRINNQIQEFTENDFVDNEIHFKVFISENTVDTNSTIRFKIDFGIEARTSTGIELDDGASNAASVKKINLKDGLKITKNDVANEIDLSGGLIFNDGNTGNDFTASKIQSLDKSIRIANLNGVADLSKGLSDHNEGILAFLGNDQSINSKYGRSKLYLGDTRVKGGSFVYEDKNTKSFIIQDVDPQDDPNVSGGTTFVVGLYFEPDQNTKDALTQDGQIELELVDANDNPILDTNGNPMGSIIDYKAGDIVRPELYVGECQAKASTEVHMKINLKFANEEIIGVGSNTCIMLQSITKEESSGLALLSFMAFTGYRLGFDTKYYGFNSMNLAQKLIFNEAEVDTGTTTMELGNNMYLDFRTNCKASINNNHLIIKDDGSTIPVWSLVKFYDELDSHYISGNKYKVTATLTDKNDAYKVALLNWTGTGEITKPKVESYNNSSPVFTTGWTKVDDMFIAEDPVSGEHVQSKEFTIPADSKGLAIIMYAVSSQIPENLQLKDLEGDITPWFNKVIITNNSHIRESYLEDVDYHYISKVDNSGFASYRYTCNNVDTKVPFGVVTGGNNKIINDNAWVDAGAVDPQKVQGDMKVLVDGKIKMSYQAQCFNEQGSINQVQFWFAKVNSNGTFAEVPNSRYATIIEANRVKPKKIYSGEFSFDVKANESYRMFMKSDKADGFYIQANTDGVPLYRADIDFDEVTEEEANLVERINGIDEEIVITQAAKDAGWYIELDYDTQTQKPSLSPKQRSP